MGLATLSNLGRPLAITFGAGGYALAGLALVSIPIIIHLLNRRRFKVVKWAAMDYLLQAMRKNRRRRRFEHWLLLAIRCLLLALLGLALSQPRGKALGAVGKGDVVHIIIVDNSYSMAYEHPRNGARTHLEYAKRAAADLVDAIGGRRERVAIVLAGAPSEAPTPTPISDYDAARAAVARIDQSYGGTDIAGALQKAIDIADAEKEDTEKHLYIISDSTASAWGEKSGQATLVKELGSRLGGIFSSQVYVGLGGPDQSNSAVTEVSAAGEVVNTARPASLAAMVRSSGPAKTGIMQWMLDDTMVEDGTSTTVDAQSKPQLKPNFPFHEGGAHALTVSFKSMDGLPADNTRYRVFEVASAMKVLIVEGERGERAQDSSGMFVATALDPALGAEGGPRVNYVQTELVSDLELDSKPLGEYRAVILADVGQVRPEDADRLEQFVKAGGTLMVFMGDQVNKDAYNKTMLPRGLMPGTLVARKTDTSPEAKGFVFDFNPKGQVDPAIKAFENQEHSGLDTATIMVYYQLSLEQRLHPRAVLSYQSAAPDTPKDPAITAHTLDQGQVIFISTSANGAWTGISGRDFWPALISELLGNTVNLGDAWMNVDVGKPLEIPSTLALASAPVLYDQTRKNTIAIEAAEGGGATSRPGSPVRFRTKPFTKPGIYHLSTGKSSIPIAVNVPSAESDVQTVTEEKVREALGGGPLIMVSDASSLSSLLSEDAHNRWGWVIMALLLLFAGAECFLAMLFGHHRRRPVTLTTASPVVLSA